MTMIVIAIVFTLLLCGTARRANVRFRRSDRLPMQWWFTGEVTWSAPRAIALAFVPALAVVVLVSLLLLSFNVAPKTGQEGMVFPTFIGTGVMFLVIQRLHLWLIDLTLRRSDG